MSGHVCFQPSCCETKHNELLTPAPLTGNGDLLESRGALQRGLERLDQGAEANCMRFDKVQNEFFFFPSHDLGGGSAEAYVASTELEAALQLC